VLVEAIVTALSSRGKDGIVGYGSSEARTSTLGKGVGSTTANKKTSSYGSEDNTGNHTSSDTSYGTYGESANTSALNVATFIIGNVASRDGTVISGWTHNVEDTASSNRVALVLVADIRIIANNGFIFARVGKVKGHRIARVNSASVVVVTEVGRVWIVNTTSCRDATIVGTRVVIVARSDRGPDATSTEGISAAEDARISGTGVEIVTVSRGGGDFANGSGRAQVHEVGQTSSWVTGVTRAGGGRRNGNSS